MSDPMAIALSALANSSRETVAASDVASILSTGDGPGHLVRALYGDCSFETLDRLGITLGLSRAELREGYRIAKRRHAARNADLDRQDDS